jgi:hypothetical protein
MHRLLTDDLFQIAQFARGAAQFEPITASADGYSR